MRPDRTRAGKGRRSRRRNEPINVGVPVPTGPRFPFGRCRDSRTTCRLALAQRSPVAHSCRCSAGPRCSSVRPVVVVAFPGHDVRAARRAGWAGGPDAPGAVAAWDDARPPSPAGRATRATHTRPTRRRAVVVIISDCTATRMRRRDATVGVAVSSQAPGPEIHHAARTASNLVAASCLLPAAGRHQTGSVAGGAAIPSPS